MEISQDIFIQITEMGHSKLIMGKFIIHSLSMKHLLVTNFLQQWIHLETAHCRRQPCDFLPPVYKNYKSVWESGTNSGTEARTETPYQRMCLFHTAELLFRFWFLKIRCWFACLERLLHNTSLPLLPSPLKSTE